MPDAADDPDDAAANSPAFDALNDLLDYPPVNDAELRARLQDVDAAQVARLAEQQLDDAEDLDEEGLLLEVLRHVAPQRHAELVPPPPDDAELARVPDQEALAKARPLAALPADLVESMRESIQAVVADPEVAQDLFTSIQSAPLAVRASLVEQMEPVRLRSGVPAALLYAPWLAAPIEPALHARLLDLVAVEGDSLAQALLMKLRAAAPDDATRDRIQAAWMRARNPAPGGRRPRPLDGFAFLGSCDGSGAAAVFAGMRNPDGAYTVVNLVVKLHGDVRDGFVLPHESKKSIERLIAEQAREQQIMDFTKAPLEVAARFAADGLALAAALARPPDAGTAHAAALLGRVAAAPPLPEPADAGTATEADIQRLFQTRAEYSTWFFDEGDLAAAGVTSPWDEEDADAWAPASLPRLDRPEIRRRLRAMTRHMALYHELRREPREAALLSGLCWPEEKSLVDHPLFFGMVARSWFIVRMDDFAESSFGDVGDRLTRHALKQRWFAQLDQPRGEDLAALDFTHALANLLRAAQNARLAGERRVREMEIDAQAHAAGRAAARACTRDGARTEAALAPVLATALTGGPLAWTAAEARGLGEEMAPGLVEFIEQICGVCPIACLKRPDADVAMAFFRSEHPSPGAPDLAGELEDGDAAEGQLGPGERDA